MSARIRAILGHLKHGTARQAEAGGINFFPASSTFTKFPNPPRYTLDGPKLVLEQRKFYEENGYLVVKNLVSKEDLEKYSERFQQLCTGEMETPGITFMHDISITQSEFVPGKKAVAKIQDFQFDDVLFEYCRLPEMLDYVESFVGKNIMAMHTMFINKPPDTGSQTSRHPMHQDLYYFPFRPADRIVCSWTPIVRVHPLNGCLSVLPGTHKGQFLEHSYPQWKNAVNKMYYGIQDYRPDQQARVHLEMNPGDTVFFHPLLIHGSGTNKTSEFRKSISCHFASSECQYINMEGTQQQISDEVLEVVKRKLPAVSENKLQISYQDLWHLKSRLVRGQEINL